LQVRVSQPFLIVDFILSVYKNVQYVQTFNRETHVIVFHGVFHETRTIF